MLPVPWYGCDPTAVSSVNAFPGFKLRLTRWGGIFLVSMLVLGFAAVNTGNNALMALLGLALGSYVVSGVWSRQVLGGAEVRAVTPGEIFADRPVMMEVELVNGCRMWPAYGVTLRDEHGSALLVETVLAAGSHRRHGIEVRFPSRGWSAIGPWTLEVVLPLGFFVKSKVVLDRREVLVYPRLLSSCSVAAVTDRRGRHAERFDDRGREGDVVQLREFRDGDDTRQMHWKQTARQQQPIVTDRQRRGSVPRIFVVNPWVENIDDRFETTVSEVATGVVRCLEEGVEVGLVVGAHVVAPERSPRRAFRLLRPLAEVEPGRPDHVAPTSASRGNAQPHSSTGGA
jgi:uncharacterized protein (DUF58 family)